MAQAYKAPEKETVNNTITATADVYDGNLTSLTAREDRYTIEAEIDGNRHRLTSPLPDRSEADGITQAIEYVRDTVGDAYADELGILDQRWKLDEIYLEETDDGFDIEAETQKAIIYLTPGDFDDREMGDYPFDRKEE